HNITKVPADLEEPLLYLPFRRIIINGIFIGSSVFLAKALFVDIKHWSKKVYKFFENFNK
ncbi:unnamed protein product, partial [marine sediment metagenome]